jgi:hypothetical protein
MGAPSGDVKTSSPLPSVRQSFKRRRSASMVIAGRSIRRRRFAVFVALNGRLASGRFDEIAGHHETPFGVKKFSVPLA